jgi:anti-sigma factor RsiW
MPCEQWRDQLDTYLDGELTSDQTRSLDGHLRSCTACAAEALARVQVKRAVKSAGMAFAVSPQFRAKIHSTIAPKPKPGWRRGWLLVTVALGVVTVAALFTSYRDRQNLIQEQFISEIADLHVSTLASANPVDVVSTDRHTVKPWFQGKIPFTFNLPELQNTDFTLLGGRVVYLGQVPGAELIYQIRKHNVSVFIFPSNLIRSGELSETGKAHSFNLASWSEDGLQYFVVGDTSLDDIQKLAALLKAAVRA